MIICFNNKALEDLCSNPSTMARRLGEASAKKLRARLADLSAATSVADLVAGKPHPLKGDRSGQFAVSLAGGQRLVFASSDDPPPVDEHGNVSWRAVRSVRIIFIGDYHD